MCEGPGFNSSRCQLYGLGVRHFKVSGGVPSPPEQPPRNRFKNFNERLAESKQQIYIHTLITTALSLFLSLSLSIYIYIHTYNITYYV